MTIRPTFDQPPQPRNADGEIRRAGFELEYTGVNIEAACAIVQDIFGGAIKQTNPFLYTVEGTRFGDFQVEVDATLLKEAHLSLSHAGLSD